MSAYSKIAEIVARFAQERSKRAGWYGTSFFGFACVTGQRRAFNGYDKVCGLDKIGKMGGNLGRMGKRRSS